MKYSLSIFTAVLAVLAFLISCGGSDSGSIYGVVTDKATGEPIKNAGVELLPVGLKTVTGSDGSFDFNNLTDGRYGLFVTQDGYFDVASSEIIVADGKAQKHDVHMEKAGDVLTLNATKVKPTSAVLNGKLLDNESQYSELGFVYGRMGNPSLDNNAMKTATTIVQTGTFSEVISNLTEGKTYYFRAYARRYNGETVYGNTMAFVPTSPYYVILSDGLVVSRDDAGKSGWGTALSLCKNYTAGGFNDWSLPSKDELVKLYNNKKLIGSFKDEDYWSSSVCSNCYYNEEVGESYDRYWYQNFNNGKQGTGKSEENKRIRCIRYISR